MKGGLRISSRTWLALFGALSCALLIVSQTVHMSEPFDDFREMANKALWDIAFWWILGMIVAVLLIWVMRQRSAGEHARQLPSSKVISAFSAYIIIGAFSLAQIVVSARDRADLIQGRPTWLHNMTFDVMGSPLTLLFGVIIFVLSLRRGYPSGACESDRSSLPPPPKVSLQK